MYQVEYRGFVEYYLLAQDVYRLGSLRWAMETSRLKTLAARHHSTVAKMSQKYRTMIETPNGPRRCFQVIVKRDEGRKPLVACLGGISLRRQRTAVLTDLSSVMASARRNELIHRLLVGRCEICEVEESLHVHRIRKLADLNRPGRRERPTWVQLMARHRKSLVVCRRCHREIHAGRATERLLRGLGIAPQDLPYRPEGWPV